MAYSSQARSGSLAAVLSAIFPGLGQAYLRRPRTALVFALPMTLVVLGLVVIFSARGAAYRVIDPTIAFALIVLAVVVGIWWISAVIDAWLAGHHAGSAAVAIVILMVFAIGGADAFASVQLWRVRNAGIEIFTGDPLDPANNPYLNATASPSPGPSPSPTPSTVYGQPTGTPAPTPSPTPRPPTYVDPSDDPGDEPTPTIEPGPTPVVDVTALDAQDDGLLNVLLGGVDWLPGRVGARTDTMVVISINSDTGEVLMFSFPRDTQRFPLFTGGTFPGKLNTFAGVSKLYPEVFSEPGMKSLAYEIGFLLGVPIDYYASVNMVGFMDVVAQVGGVTVCNEREIADDQLQFYLPPGLQHLGPEDALRYVRSRHGQAGGDFARARRQQQVLAALRKELLKPDNVTRLPDIIEALADVINTDFPPERISDLVHLADQVEAEPSRSWVFKYPEWAQLNTRAETGGRQVVELRMEKIATLSVQLFGEKSLYYGHLPNPTPDLGPTPGPSPSPDASASPGPCGAPAAPDEESPSPPADPTTPATTSSPTAKPTATP